MPMPTPSSCRPGHKHEQRNSVKLACGLPITLRDNARHPQPPQHFKHMYHGHGDVSLRYLCLMGTLSLLRYTVRRSGGAFWCSVLSGEGFYSRVFVSPSTFNRGISLTVILTQPRPFGELQLHEVTTNVRGAPSATASEHWLYKVDKVAALAQTDFPHFTICSLIPFALN
jgi:hypothetical protein